MARTEHTIAASAEQVFAVLANGWTYSDWVVGTAHIRDVDATWPEAGGQIHHKAGPWPLSLWERTVSLECEPPRRLVMRPRLWPFGEATVRITLTDADAGGTRIVLEEQFTGGPLLAVRNRVNDMVLSRRNAESLRRLANIVERSHRPTAR
ncbi:SRPBCC family protein [Asanoa sp. NPDC049573]|uniref:SRPBCC family protein n=1 Tax=Asanoa sp. NPDC049573 TaxID=3155396 RepID=UPI0034323049